MALLVSVAVLLSLLLVSNGEREARIIGGSTTDTSYHLHQVSLGGSGGHFCGGSIIDTHWVLTAAHCVEDETTSSFAVVVDRDYDNITYSVQAIFTHPSYVKGETSIGYVPHDIALLKTTTAIQDAANYKVDLPPADDTFVGENCTITGWGLVDGLKDTDVLMETHGIILSDTECDSHYGSSYNHTHNICIHNDDSGACSGDSGGPMVCEDYTLVGLASFVSGDCDVTIPSVYVRVVNYIGWIGSIMANN